MHLHVSLQRICLVIVSVALFSLVGTALFLFIHPLTTSALTLNQTSPMFSHSVQATSPYSLEISPTPSSTGPSQDAQTQQLYTVAQNDITVANGFVTFAGVILSIVAVVVAIAGILEILGRRQIESRIQQVAQLELRLEQQLETRTQQFATLEHQIEEQVQAFAKRLEQLDKEIINEQSAFQEHLKDLAHRFENENQQFMEASYNFSMGKAAYLDGDDQHTIEYFLEALKLWPNNPRILERIGRSYSNLNDIAQAIFYLDRALAIDPSHIPSLRSLALCYRGTEPQKAIDYLNRALKVNPAGFEALDFLGLIHRDLGLVEEAIGYHERALAIKKRPETEFYLSILYAMKGDIKGAKVRALSAEYDTYKQEHDKRMRPVWKNLVQSSVHIIDGNKEKALQLIRESTHDIKTQRIYEALKGHLEFLLQAHDHSDWLPEFMELVRLQGR